MMKESSRQCASNNIFLRRNPPSSPRDLWDGGGVESTLQINVILATQKESG